MIKFTGFSIIEDIFDFLEVEYELNNASLGKLDIKELHSSDWTNIRIIKFYKIQNKSKYFSYLCIECLSHNYRIVPVKEIRRNDSNNSILYEDSFLFTIKGRLYLYIIWENQHESRATFIFRCKTENYDEAIQRIFDYIRSDEITSKREKLHTSKMAYFNNKTVKYIASVAHPVDDFETWKRRLNGYLQ